jgi:hypothetical protein
MSERAWERAGAATGFAMVLFGAAAEVFERAPTTRAGGRTPDQRVGTVALSGH